jgi:hypothetical protein
VEYLGQYELLDGDSLRGRRGPKHELGSWQGDLILRLDITGTLFSARAVIIRAFGSSPSLPPSWDFRKLAIVCDQGRR